MDNVLEHLPLNEVVCYDYSEGYRCHQQDELQLEYFDVNVSLQSTILYHQAVESIDGMTSTENDPHIRWVHTSEASRLKVWQELKYTCGHERPLTVISVHIRIPSMLEAMEVVNQDTR